MELGEQKLIEMLEKVEVKASFQEESQQLAATLSFHGSDYPMFIRELSDANLLQMIIFIPCTVQEESADDLARLLHMINKELDMPGFCWDEDSRTVFYRLIIPALQKNCDETLFQVYIETTKRVCSMFGTIIQAIAIGAMSLQEMMQKAQELSDEKKSETKHIKA